MRIPQIVVFAVLVFTLTFGFSPHAVAQESQSADAADVVSETITFSTVQTSPDESTSTTTRRITTSAGDFVITTVDERQVHRTSPDRASSMATLRSEQTITLPTGSVIRWYSGGIRSYLEDTVDRRVGVIHDVFERDGRVYIRASLALYRYSNEQLEEVHRVTQVNAEHHQSFDDRVGRYLAVTEYHAPSSLLHAIVVIGDNGTATEYRYTADDGFDWDSAEQTSEGLLIKAANGDETLFNPKNKSPFSSRRRSF